MKKLKNIVLILTLVCTSVSMSLAQSGGALITGNAYIPSFSEIGVHDNLVFRSNGEGTYPGVIITNRDSQNPGAVAFVNNAYWRSANDAQHVDGFVSVYSDQPFTFPIGNTGYYKPVSISGGYGTKAAYYFDNPLKLASVNDLFSLRASTAEEKEMTLHISDKEYWDIRGENETEVTFYWDFNSDIERLTDGDLSNLAVVGWNGTSWEVISSSVDDFMIDINVSSGAKSNLKSDYQIGSITTETLIPNDYEVFAFAGLHNGEFENEVVFGSERFLDERIEMTVFPNPAINLSDVNIDYNISQVKSDAFLHVFDELGEILYSQQLFDSKGIVKLPYQENTSGLYHIGIVTDAGSKVFKPVVVTF